MMILYDFFYYYFIRHLFVERDENAELITTDDVMVTGAISTKKERQTGF